METPCASSRLSHARSSGEAFIAFGKMRPLEPVKVSCPSPSAQAIAAAGDDEAALTAAKAALKRAENRLKVVDKAAS